LLAGDHTFEDGLGLIHYCRLGDLLRVLTETEEKGVDTVRCVRYNT